MGEDLGRAQLVVVESNVGEAASELEVDSIATQDERAGEAERARHVVAYQSAIQVHAVSAAGKPRIDDVVESRGGNLDGEVVTARFEMTRIWRAVAVPAVDAAVA